MRPRKHVSDPVTPARLALRNIEDNLCFTAHEALPASLPAATPGISARPTSAAIVPAVTTPPAMVIAVT